MKKVVVIGAGVNGLSCAVKIAEYFYRRNVQVLCISEDVSPNTTGDISAGLWGPYLIGGSPDEKIVQWSKSSHDFFLHLWQEGLADEAGISMIPVYRLTAAPEGHQEPCWKDVVFGFKILNPHELQRLSNEHNRAYTGGSNFISFCCEPTKFLPYLMKRFFAAGGRFVKQKVLSIDEGFEDVDLIVNCSGLGSKELTNDKKFEAIRGQVARVKASWVHEVTLHEDDDGNYVIPNTDCVVLGGTHQVEDYNLKVSPEDSEFIFNGCKRIVPSLRDAVKLSEVVGLRPGRECVRLETEHRDGKAPVIHNVGHGGCGVSLCWGCADEVLEKTIEVLNQKVSKI